MQFGPVLHGRHFFVSRDQNVIAEQWNGHHWKVRTPPRPAFAGGAELTGVSCLSASHCSAVGFHDRFTLAERYS